MIKVFTAQNHAEAHLMRGLLEAEGIPAEVQGEALSALDGGLAVLGFRPTVWIPEENDLPRATELVEHFSRRQPSFLHPGSPWHCPQCEERHEAQFTECWHCGTSRPESPED